MTAYPRQRVGEDVFTIKQDDTTDPIFFQALNTRNEVVPLIGALSVQFIYRKRDAKPVTAVERTATIANADSGMLRYDWVPADTASAGDYYAEWVVTFPNAQQQTFPVRGYQSFVVEAKLG